MLCVQLLESYLHRAYTAELEVRYLGDPQQLMDGSVELRRVLSRNVDAFLREKRLLDWGVRCDVLVISHDDRILYPNYDLDVTADIVTRDPMEVASENFALLEKGLDLTTDVRLPYNSPLSGVLLGLLVAASAATLVWHYRHAVRLAARESKRQSKAFETLQAREKNLTSRLDALDAERSKLLGQLRTVGKDLEEQRNSASRNEDALFDEITQLEEKIAAQELARREQAQEIEELREALNKDLAKVEKQRAKAADRIQRRFRAIYKNTTVHDKAVQGLVELTEDQKLRGEEVIFQLNSEPDAVSVKRKVFQKKGHETVFEVNFAYRGRLYFRKTSDNKVEVLAIGTKNTQNRDLNYIGSV